MGQRVHDHLRSRWATWCQAGGGAYDINNRGQSVGYCRFSSSPLFKPTLWNGIGDVLDLGSLPGNGRAIAYALNDNGVIVGQAFNVTGESRGFVWSPDGGMRDLTDLLNTTGTGWTIDLAYDINSYGQIAAKATNPTGLVRAVLLTPTSSAVAMAPSDVTPTIGTYLEGNATQLTMSDNLDFRMQRSLAGLQAIIEFEAISISPTPTPSTMTVVLEGSVFSRAPVVQSMELFNFSTSQWETVDVRNAPRFSDQAAAAGVTGDPRRFVEPVTLTIKTRIRFQGSSPRAQFATNTDQLIWIID